jgi:DNA-binding GntR family transcriptional regulator
MPTTLKRQIADSLRGQILAGRWAEGTRIKEEALAKHFGVSRGPIRDVMLELSKEGLLQALPNKGASINVSPSKKARAIYLRTRRDLETLALREGFPNWTEEAILSMGKILRQFRVAAEVEDLSEVIEHDIAFHRAIIENYSKENLRVLWLPLMTTMALPYSRHQDLMESHKEHEDIMRTLKSNDLKAAIRLLKDHIQ